MKTFVLFCFCEVSFQLLISLNPLRFSRPQSTDDKKEKQLRELTQLCLSIGLLFLVCESPRTIIPIYHRFVDRTLTRSVALSQHSTGASLNLVKIQLRTTQSLKAWLRRYQPSGTNKPFLPFGSLFWKELCARTCTLRDTPRNVDGHKTLGFECFRPPAVCSVLLFIVSTWCRTMLKKTELPPAPCPLLLCFVLAERPSHVVSTALAETVHAFNQSTTRSLFSRLLLNIAFVFTAFDHSMNFFIYVLRGERFREALLEALPCCGRFLPGRSGAGKRSGALPSSATSIETIESTMAQQRS